MGCVTSASIAVLVNGEATSFFRKERGLRQGCPLSPILFILPLQGLHFFLKEKKQEALITGIEVSRLISVLHLFFVDDISLATKKNLNEWLEIKVILNTFCGASGLQINEVKSTFHYSGLLEEDLATFKSIFPFCYQELSLGFHYLSYFLKLDYYKTSFWNWLLIKFESRITHWSNRWLALGGRFILLKSVLEVQAVF